MSKKTNNEKISRKEFLHRLGIMGAAAGLMAVTKKDIVHAEVGDNSTSDNLSNDKVYYESADVDSSNILVPKAADIASTMPAKLTTGEKLESVFAKISQIFKNVRYLFKFIGTSDISDLSDSGTVTDALLSIDTRIQGVYQATSDFEANHQYKKGDIVLVGSRYYECIKSCFTGTDVSDSTFNINASGVPTTFLIKVNGVDTSATWSTYWKASSDTLASVRADLGYPSDASAVSGASAFAKIATLYTNFSNALTTLKNTAVAKAVGATGSTFTDVISKLATITNQGAQTKSLNCGESYAIPAGYHNGSGKITANSLASQTKVDSGKSAAVASAMLAGYQAWVNGNKITGNITTRNTGSQDVTSNKTVSLPAGYYPNDHSVKVNVSSTGELAVGSVTSTKNGISSSSGYSYWGTMITSYSLLKSDYFSFSGGILTAKKSCRVCVVIDADYYMGRAWAKAYFYLNSNGNVNNAYCVAQGAENVSPQTAARIINLNVGDKLFVTIESQNNNAVSGWARIFLCS